MKSDAYIRVSCDFCGDEEEIELTALAGHGAWDERNVSGALRSMGWSEDGDEHVCETCQEEHDLPSS